MKRLASNKRPSGAKYVFASSMVHSPSFCRRFAACHSRLTVGLKTDNDEARPHANLQYFRGG
jgi:hypothetical protein